MKRRPGEETADSPGLRIDAERNRVRIIEAARAAFAEQGLEVPIDEIARRAGVGIATLYRRFPTRGDLVSGAYEAKMTAYAEAAAKALRDPDPWNGFCRYVKRISSMQVADRGFTSVLIMTFPTSKQLEAIRDRAYRGFTELVDRAKAAGKLRADFVPEDLIMLLMANAGVVTATAGNAPRMSPRLVGYLLASFAAPGSEPLPPAPTPQQAYRALLRLYSTDVGPR